MSKRINASSKLFACACVAAFSFMTGCGDDDAAGGLMQPIAGSSGLPGSGGQLAGTGTGGKNGSNTTGNTGGSGGGGGGGSGAAGSGGSTGAGGSTSTQCGTQSCDGTCCGTECIKNLDSNHDHCGNCGKACRMSETCSAGQCISMPRTCDPGQDDAGTSNDNGCLPHEKCVSVDGAPGQCRCGTGPGCSENETCSTAGDCMCGKAAGCAKGSGCCGAKCIDISSDEANCGACGLTCATGATCKSGECVCDVAGRVACDGKCVDINTDKNCGECGNACEAPSTCRDPSGSRPLGCYCGNVNEVPCNGACVALGTVQNCGECGDACNGAESVCRNGSCQCPTVGQTACGGSCVDLRTGVDGDPGTGNGQILMNNCGKCGVTCLAGAACNNGECACPSASTTDKYCDEDPVTGKTDGKYACIEVTTTKNCGGCGTACLDDSSCHQSNPGTAPSDFACQCMGDDAGKTHCTGIGCRNLNNDEANCGMCGRACPANVNCVAGACDCPGASSVESCLVDGEAKCIDTDIDNKNCGGCGTVCATGQECCGGNCVNPDTAFNRDNQNCGACGNACPNSGCGFLMLFGCSCSNGVCN